MSLEPHVIRTTIPCRCRWQLYDCQWPAGLCLASLSEWSSMQRDGLVPPPKYREGHWPWLSEWHKRQEIARQAYRGWRDWSALMAEVPL